MFSSTLGWAGDVGMIVEVGQKENEKLSRCSFQNEWNYFVLSSYST